ncbi:branched-chain amino acid ABC transporter permease [Actinomycetospora atypica]|uniref:Branched-chain amino acid ABC transporter permease n=1 Tax=Actinomycetospora atypica TaxID=1290095 RepID=A0ABV9YFP0_9PSEU
MQRFLDLTLSGVSQGAIYAAFALALVLIWRSTRVVNFAQGSMAMFTTYLALLAVDAGWPYAAALVLALGTGLVLGAVIERVVMRPVENGPEINPVIVTLGIFIALQALASLLFSAQYRSFPAPFGLSGLQVGGVNVAVTPYGLFVIGAVAVTLLALVALFRFTDLGLRLRASAFDGEVARLLGVPVGRMLTLGWALAAVVGSLSGLLIAGGSLVWPAYMDGLIVFGFVAAVLGGLESPGGAVVGGLVLGIALSYVSGYLGSELAGMAALVVLVAVLLVRPAGLFGRTTVRRV